MRKLFTLGIILLIGASSLFGQAMVIIDPPAGLMDMPVDSSEIKVPFTVTNTSSSTITVKVKRIENEMYSASDTFHSNYFCWDFCYGISVDESAEGIDIAPGDTLNTAVVAQYVSFQPGGIDGYSFAKYQFINTTAENEVVEVLYEFSVGGVNAITNPLELSKALSSPFPNPASHKASIKYDLPYHVDASKAKLHVLNLIGKEVAVLRLEGSTGTLNIPTDKLRSGIYLINLKIEGKNVTSRKLVIAK